MHTGYIGKQKRCARLFVGSFVIAWAPLLLVALLTPACTDYGDGSSRTAAVVVQEPRIQAVTLDARRRPAAETLAEIRRLGTTHLTLIPFGFQPTPQTPSIRMHTESRWHSESDEGIRDLARRADLLGMRVILKPHIWIGEYNAEGQTRHRVGFETEEGWKQWQDEYRQFLLHYAKLAEAIDAPVLVIGTELSHAVRTRPNFWRGLIGDVRDVYGGKLTYAANWYEDYQEVSFWDALDYIGVQAYFPISEADQPTVDVLKRGWETHCDALEALSHRTGRPVLFTEVGYRSVSYAAAEPWRWPSREEAGSTTPDEAMQAHLYRAFFERVWTAPWMAGAMLWKWQAHPREDRHPLSFSPQGKQAEEVIRKGFSGPSS